MPGKRPSRPPRCPSCEDARVAAILYGMPAIDEQLERDLASGRIALGGCCVSEGAPEWRCGNCNYEWGALARRDDWKG